MDPQGWIATIFGIVFISLMAAIGIWLTVKKQHPPPAAMFIFRAILALAAAGVGVFLPGTLKVDVSEKGVAIRATAGLALFLLIFLFTPKAITALSADADDAKAVPEIPAPKKKSRRVQNKEVTPKVEEKEESAKSEKAGQ